MKKSRVIHFYWLIPSSPHLPLFFLPSVTCGTAAATRILLDEAGFDTITYLTVTATHTSILWGRHKGLH